MSNLHGSGNDYSETNYTASNQPITVRCHSHGNFTMLANAHQQGKGCPTCAAEIREQEKQSDFLQDMKTKYGDRLDFTDSVFKNVKAPVKAYCKIHHEHFVTNGKGILLGRGCLKCKSEKISHALSMTQEEYLAEINAAHGEMYGHDSVVYTDAKNNVTVHCYKHGDFEIQAYAHLRGRGCPKCSYEAFGLRCKSNTKEFSAKATVLKQDKYNYSRAVYVDSHTPVEILCTTCSFAFMQSPTSHLGGSGCPACAKTGFDASQPAYIYVLTSGDMTKVGITNVSPHSRSLAMTRGSGHEFSILASFFSASGAKVKQVEKAALAWLRSEYKHPSKDFKGYTECFVGADRQAIIKFVETSLTN